MRDLGQLYPQSHILILKKTSEDSNFSRVLRLLILEEKAV